MKTFIKLSITFLSIIVLSLVTIELLYSVKKAKPFSFPINKTWLHRVNTLEKISTLDNKTEPGLEIDVFYYSKQNKFYVLHDWEENPAETLSLENYLLQVQKSNKHLWIDLKNLTSKNKDPISRELKILLDRFKLSDKTLIESQNGWAHIALSKTGLNCSYWLNTYSRSRLFWLRNLENKLILILGNFISVSFSQNGHNRNVEEMFNQFPILLFSIENQNNYEVYEKNSKLKVLLKASY